MTGIESGEKIFTEALVGRTEYDAVKIVAELQSRFVKGWAYWPGRLTGRSIFPDPKRTR